MPLAERWPARGCIYRQQQCGHSSGLCRIGSLKLIAFSVFWESVIIGNLIKSLITDRGESPALNAAKEG